MKTSAIEAALSWERKGEKFVDGKYSRAHCWQFDGGLTVPASSSPDIVPLPYSVETAIDPEEAFVASLSSCHLLWFLSIAAKRGYRVNSYHDAAVGVLEQNGQGKLVISVVRLRPYIEWDGEKPDDGAIVEMHRLAHDECMIANSVRTIVLTEPVFQPMQPSNHSSRDC